MAIHVALKHVTRYKYDRPVQLGPQVIRLRPAPHCRTPILSYSLRVEPAKHFINWQQDPFANYLARLVFPEKTTEFTVTVDLVAEMAVYNPFDFFLEPYAQTFPFAYDEAQQIELAPYLQAGPATPLLLTFRGQRFRLGDACEWVARDAQTGQERGRSAIEVLQLNGLAVRYDTPQRPAGIQRDAMGARLRDGFALYEDPLVDLPAEYALGLRWSGSARLRLSAPAVAAGSAGAAGVLDYTARIVGRQAIVIGSQSFEAWVVQARGSCRLNAFAQPLMYTSRLWALPQFGVPLRHEVRLGAAQEASAPGAAQSAPPLPTQDEVVECLWVRLAR